MPAREAGADDDERMRTGTPGTANALGVGLLLGGLAGAALADLDPGWVWSAAAGATIGGSAAALAVLGQRLRVGPVATGVTAGAVAGLQGLLFGYLAHRGDSELADSLLGLSVIAAVLGLVCVGIAWVLAEADAEEAG